MFLEMHASIRKISSGILRAVPGYCAESTYMNFPQILKCVTLCGVGLRAMSQNVHVRIFLKSKSVSLCAELELRAMSQNLSFSGLSLSLFGHTMIL